MICCQVLLGLWETVTPLSFSQLSFVNRYPFLPGKKTVGWFQGFFHRLKNTGKILGRISSTQKRLAISWDWGIWSPGGGCPSSFSRHHSLGLVFSCPWIPSWVIRILGGPCWDAARWNDLFYFLEKKRFGMPKVNLLWVNKVLFFWKCVEYLLMIFSETIVN